MNSIYQRLAFAAIGATLSFVTMKASPVQAATFEFSQGGYLDVYFRYKIEMIEQQLAAGEISEEEAKSLLSQFPEPGKLWGTFSGEDINSDKILTFDELSDISSSFYAELRFGYRYNLNFNLAHLLEPPLYPEFQPSLSFAFNLVTRELYWEYQPTQFIGGKGTIQSVSPQFGSVTLPSYTGVSFVSNDPVVVVGEEIEQPEKVPEPTDIWGLSLVGLVSLLTQKKRLSSPKA